MTVVVFRQHIATIINGNGQLISEFHNPSLHEPPLFPRMIRFSSQSSPPSKPSPSIRILLSFIWQDSLIFFTKIFVWTNSFDFFLPGQKAKKKKKNEKEMGDSSGGESREKKKGR